jgi:hypothetical protein
VEPLSIRPATSDDVSLILRFIRALGEYEHLAHEAVATEDGLRESLFGKTPQAEVAIASMGPHPVGFALFFHNYSTFLGRRGRGADYAFDGLKHVMTLRLPGAASSGFVVDRKLAFESPAASRGTT